MGWICGKCFEIENLKKSLKLTHDAKSNVFDAKIAAKEAGYEQISQLLDEAQEAIEKAEKKIRFLVKES